jgi:serine/threonine protein kinase
MTVNNCYIVTEYCSGGDLATYLKQRGRLSEKEAIGFIRDIVNGYLELAHRNILHRDIKPANILLAEGSCRIADFGFAKFDREPGQREKYHVGTPLYMSPQALTCNIYSTKNDIFSLGVMFFELLHGYTPWQNCRT